MHINKRDEVGKPIVPTPLYADKAVDSDADKDADKAIVLDETKSPDTPISDLKVENFLMDIVENAVTGTNNLFQYYCKCKFNINKPIPLAKNDMRKLLNNPRVKERLKYLRDSEWELNKPHIMQLSRKFEDLIADEELKPNDKINALNSLAKLVGCFEKEQTDRGNKIAIIFNSPELPPVSINK